MTPSPLAPDAPDERPSELLVVSAKTPAALEAVTERLVTHLTTHADLPLADVAFTLQAGRQAFRHRRAVAATSVADAVAQLRARDGHRVFDGVAEFGSRAVAFLFSGGGTQYVHMGRALLPVAPVFRDELDRALALCLPARDLRPVLFPAAAEESAARAQLEQPSWGLPALFAVQYALARQFMAWGVLPTALIGHSMGEYTAACLAGVMSLADALRLVLLRGQLFETLPAGGMLAVPLDETRLRAQLPADLAIAAINADQSCVVAGPLAALAHFEHDLAATGLEARRLHINVAAHSPMVAPILDEFSRFLGTVPLAPPTLPVVSNLTGAWLTPAQAQAPDYWTTHLRETVRFADGLQVLCAEPNRVLLEVGPGQTLAGFARLHPARQPHQPVLGSMRPAKDLTPDWTVLQHALGRLWTVGVTLDWSAYNAAPPHHRRHRLGDLAAMLEGDSPPAEGTALAEASLRNQPADSLSGGTERFDRIRERLREIVRKVSGLAPSDISPTASLIELGLDSLTLSQAALRFKSEFNVPITLRQLFDEAPSLSSLASYIDGILPTSTDALGLGEAAVLTADIPVEPVSRPAPCSHAQERMWVLSQLADGSAYVLPMAVAIEGPLNREALRASLRALVARHAILRTTFPLDGDRPAQIVHDVGTVDLLLRDSRGSRPEQRLAIVNELVREDVQRGFDLTSEVPFRCHLITFGPHLNTLVIVLHHIACDGWSKSILFRDLAALYHEAKSGGSPAIPTLSHQYVDYARRERQASKAPPSASALHYWTQHLAGAPALLVLPTDRPRPAVQTGAGSIVRRELAEKAVDLTRAAGAKHDVTPYMILLAALQLLLSRYSTQTDICVGTPISTRSTETDEQLLGLFVNTIVLRGQLADKLTFREFLRQVRQTAIAAYEHQDLPFEQLIDSLQLPRSVSHTPLVQVMFQVRNYPAVAPRLDELKTTLLEVDPGTAPFDLNMDVTVTDGRWLCTLNYSTALFDASTAQRMLSHFEALVVSALSDVEQHLSDITFGDEPTAPRRDGRLELSAIVAEPDRRLSELSTLTAAERHDLLVARNDTSFEYPHDRCVHELFEAQAARTPHATALVSGAERWSYRDVNRWANRLAHHLRRRGVDAGTFVGLAIERSVELVVGALAILKAGGSYVPLDVDLPRLRLDAMVLDAGIGVVVTRRRFLNRLPATPAEVICLDDAAGASEGDEAAGPAIAAAPDQLAYVMFTSGSTGRPKGVAVRHRSIVRLVCAQDYATFGPDRVFVQLAPASFDASTFEIWGSLLHGATLILAPAGVHHPRELEDLLVRHGVTTLWLTASLFNQLVDDRPEVLAGVSEVLTGGEALSVRHVRRAQQVLGPRVQLINGYGPTEGTTFTTCYRIPAELPPDLESIPIGRPIANTQVYVLDARREPVPVGVPGELYIGGPGLAAGYLGDPDLTAERFVAHPFSDEPGARLYRTGDRCRWRADGELEFLGRLDDQVKLRGFRIELGEIEAALRQHPTLADATVLAREDAPGDKRLVAYVVAKAGFTLDKATIREHLKETLPDYMVPAAFVTLQAMPLNANGKIDRKALPAPTAEIDRADFVTPRNDTERLLATIWSEVLRAGRVGIHDNFFELGGDSILAIQVLSRLRQAGLQLSLQELFERQTIAELAPLATKPRDEVALSARLQARESPLLPSQHWFFEHQAENPRAFSESYLLRCSKPLDPQILQAALSALEQQHDALRLRFNRHGASVLASFAAAVPAPKLEVIELSGMTSEESDRARATHLAKGHEAIDHVSGPVWNATYFHAQPGPSHLLLTAHHLVMDRRSWCILVEDLETAYTRLERHEALNLPPEATTVATWGQRLRELAEAELFSAERDYWAEMASLDWPDLVERGSHESVGATDAVVVKLTEAETFALVQPASLPCNADVNEILLTAAVSTLADWAGVPELGICLLGDGRERLFDDVDLSRTVGSLASLVPTRLQVDGSDLSTRLVSIMNQLQSIPRRGIGFGLYRYLDRDTRLARDYPRIAFRCFDPAAQSIGTQLFRLDSVSPAESSVVGPGKKFSLAIDTVMLDRSLQITWTFNEGEFQRSTIAALAFETREALLELAALHASE